MLESERRRELREPGQRRTDRERERERERESATGNQSRAWHTELRRRRQTLREIETEMRKRSGDSKDRAGQRQIKACGRRERHRAKDKRQIQVKL